jgi:hypothetical protein
MAVPTTICPGPTSTELDDLDKAIESHPIWTELRGPLTSEDSAIPIAMYAITRAGKLRLRCSVHPPWAITSSTSFGGNTRISTPTDTRSDRRRSETGFNHLTRHSPPNYTVVTLTERYCL